MPRDNYSTKNWGCNKPAENINIFIGKLFDWRKISREKYKNKIIHKAHTFYKSHL